MGLFRKETAVVHGCSGCAVLAGVSVGLLSIGMYIDPAEGATPQDGLGVLVLGAMVFLPGLIAWFFVVRHNAVLSFRETFLGMIRNHERFTVHEMAQKIERSELQTEQLISRLSNRNTDLSLVFHRPTRQYFHRSVLESTAQVIEVCPKCGAPQGQQVVLQGETAFCTHCESKLI